MNLNEIFIRNYFIYFILNKILSFVKNLIIYLFQNKMKTQQIHYTESYIRI